MAIMPNGRRVEPLYVVPMALALVLAAATGGVLGLVWQSSGLGEEEREDPGSQRLLSAGD